MADLGSLFYNVRLRDLTDQDIQTILQKLRNIGIDLDPKKFKDSITKAVDEAEKRQFKLDIDSKVFADNIRNAIKSGIKCDIDPQNVKQSIENKLTGQTIKVEIVPLATKLRQAIKDAVKDNGGPLEVQIGPKASLLQRLVTQVLTRQGYMINISTVTGLETAIKTVTKKGYSLTLSVNANSLAQSLQTALQGMQSKTFGLQVSRNILHQSIEQALKGKAFEIQIKVMKNQARQAVQTALNQASNITAADALKYQRLMTGESKAARAELDRLRAAHIGAKDAASAHAHVSASLGGAMGSNIRIAGELGAAMASLYSIHQAKEFLSQVIEIGGELEHQKIALDTIFGDKGKTSELFGQIKGLARQSPFGVMEITKSVKALAAYGVQYNEVFDTAKRLADISAATSVDINRLILAFGKTKSRTFLDGLEAKQFAYANIPIYDLLSKKLTELEGKFVSVQEVMKRIKGKKIGFDLVKDVLWDMTDEGGKFYNMQEQLAGSVKTAWKLVRDNVELMFGEIAESAVGDSLKDVAQILQSLTKNWREVAALGSVLAGGFVVYRTAVMAANVVTASHNAAQLRSLAARKAVVAANNKAAATYRNLTQAEITEQYAAQGAAKLSGLSLLTKKKLTGAEVEALMAKKLLTKEDVLRLVALKKVTAAEAEYALVTVGMTQEDIRLLQAEIAKAEAMKRGGVMMDLVKGKAMELLATLKGFLFNPFMIATVATGAVLHLFQRNNEELEKAEDIAKDLFAKVSEGIKNLKKDLEDIKPSDGLSMLELQQGIEKMQNLIKDYSPTPIDDINDSLVAQDGHVHSLIEQYDVLKGKIEGLSTAFNGVKTENIDEWIEQGIKQSGGSTGFTRLFLDDLNTEAKDYTDALKDRSNAIVQFASKQRKAMETAVDAATKADKGFAEATKGMTSYEEKLRYLAENYENLYLATVTFNAETAKFSGGQRLQDLANASEIASSYSKMMEKMKDFAESMNANMRLHGWLPTKLTDEQKTELAVSINAWLDQLSEAGEDAKNLMRGYFSGLWNVPLKQDNIGPALQEAWKKAVKESSDAAVKQMVAELRTVGYENLSDASYKLFHNIAEETRQQVMEDIKLTSDEMQSYLKARPLTQLIQLVYTTDPNAPSDLEKEIIKQKGYPLYNGAIESYVHTWTKSNSVYSARNAAQEALQNAKNELDAAKKANVGIAEAQKKYDEVWAALTYLGWTDLSTKDQKSNKDPKGSQKDPLAEALKQRFKDLKDAWSEFQKWEKSIGTDAAFEKIAESGLFSMLPEDKIPRTANEYRERVKELLGELEKAGIAGHSQRESLLNELLKEDLTIDKSLVDKYLKTALDTVEREYDRQLKNWDLYDSIRKATGNEKLAVSLAFGVDAEAQTDYAKLVKDRFKAIAKSQGFDVDYDTTDFKKAVAMGDAVAKAWEDATKKLESYAGQQRKSVADILQEYQSASDKIAAINEDRRRKIEAVNKDTNLSDASKAKLTGRINAEADYKVFEQSMEYLEFFSSIYSLTLSQAQQIGDAIQQNLDQRLQAGTISAEDYYKEIERIRQQIDKIRNARSNAFTFMTKGFNGLFEKQSEQNESNRQKVVIEIQKTEEEIAAAKERGDHGAAMAAESRLLALKKELALYDKIRDKIVKNQKLAEDISAIVGVVDNIAKGLTDSFNTIKEMADSFGVDVDSDAWDAVGAALESVTAVTGGISKAIQSAMQGDIGGLLSGVVDTLLSPITIWNKFHDRRLQKDIEKSEKQVDQLNQLIDAIERRMEHYLGNRKFSLVPGIEDDIKNLEYFQRFADSTKDNINKGYGGLNFALLQWSESNRDKYQARVDAYDKGGALGYERQLMAEELAELEQQKRDMEAMKKKDPEAIAELEDQIDEQKQAIRDFAEEMAETIYGINLTDWAEQLGDALVNAFAKGEDAAEAFNKTTGNILRSLVSKMAATNILAPMFKDVEDYLFGEDGKSGVYGEDFELDANDVAGLKTYFDRIENEGIPAIEQLYDVVNEITGGLLDDVEGADNTVRGGIQNVTEDTADLLTSYINAIRAYCAENNVGFNEFFRETMPRLSAIAEGQLTQLNMIAENTRRNMVAAEAMQQSAAAIEQTLSRATKDKSYGFYVK